MKPLNIVIVLSYLSTGGAERVAVNYANWLINNTNCKLTFIIFNESETLYSLNEKITKIFLIKKDTQLEKVQKIFKRIIDYRKYLNQINPDIIMTMFQKTTLYTLICKPKKTLIISSERCNINKCPFFKRNISKLVASMCDGYIFQTKRMANLYPLKVREKSIVIPNSVSLTLKNKKRIIKKHIVGMGRLTSQKGFDILILSFADFVKVHSDYKLFIIGDGEEKNNLIKLVHKLNLDNKVVFLGNQKEPENYLLESEMFILSSRYEGMPNALMEAMACGLPCISTNCEAGPSELIENYKNGILVEVDNIKELSSKMIELASNKDLQEKLGENAKKILLTNSPDKIFSSYYNYMKDVYQNSIKKGV